jgi:hypothetical protein
MADIDIDLADRTLLLNKLQAYTQAAIINPQTSETKRHASGIYPTKIPYNPKTDLAVLDYREAENRGYFKIDLLNMGVYSQIASEQELLELMNTEPPWDRINHDQEFVEQLVHLHNSWNAIQSLPEPIDSIPRLAMFLVIIRPSKKHLLGKPWKEVSKTVWIKDDQNDAYYFKKSHSISYAHLVVVHANLLNKPNQLFTFTTGG